MLSILKGSIRLSIIILAIFVVAKNITAETDTKSEIDEFINVVRLSNRVLVIRTGVFYFDAVTAVATEKGIVVFDAGLAPSLTKKYREIIEKEFKRKDFAYLINTHGHWDHTNGNKVFKEAAIIGHENGDKEILDDFSDKAQFIKWFNGFRDNALSSLETVDAVSEYGKQLRCRAEIYSQVVNDFDTDFSYVLPTMTFNDRLYLDMGDVTLQLMYFGKAHSDNDIVIYIPEEKLLMSGDLFNIGGSVNFSQLNAGNVTKKDVEQWHKTMITLLSDEYKIDLIIDGHAAMMTKDDLVAFNNNVEYLWNEFREGRELSARIGLEKEFRSSGLQAMIDKYNDMKTKDKDKYFYFERSLVDFGYHLLKENETEGAIEVFKVVVEQFHGSWNAYDSLGEAYLENGNNELAIENYKKSLVLNPDNEAAKDVLKRLDKTGN
ncbi:MBL fold metallo-hydrolase [Bacteroidota bacterium]